MTERILEKLIALDEYSEKMMEMRALKCQMRNISVKKSLALPLTFEFYTGFERPCPKIIASKLKESFQKKQPLVNGQKMDSKVASGQNVWKPKVLTSGLLPRKCLFGKANIRPYSVPGNLKYHPLVEKLQPSEIPEKWKMAKPFLNLKYKGKTETGHIISWVGTPESMLPLKEPDFGTAEFSTPYYQSSHKENEKLPGKNKFPCQKSVKISDPSDILTKDGIKVRKKTTTPKDTASLRKNKWFRDVFSPGHDVENETTHLIPLSFEDELNKPNAKIINLDQAKQDVPSPTLSSTKPIVFHDMGYVQMFFLTRNRHYLKNKEKPITAKTNLVLKKNNEIIKSLISDPLSAVFNAKGTLLDEWQVDAATTPEMAENWVKEDSHRTVDFSSDQIPGEDFQRSQDSAPDPSQFRYSSNARHSKYLQNFRAVRKGERMTHLDNLLSRKPPEVSPAFKTINETQNLGNKPQTPSTFKQNEKLPGSAFASKAPEPERAEFKQNEKLPGSAFESKAPEPERVEQAIKEDHVDFKRGKPLFLTSLEDSKNWVSEKAASGPSSYPFNNSTKQ